MSARTADGGEMHAATVLLGSYAIGVVPTALTSMAAEEAPERTAETYKLLEEQGERYEHWKGGREQVDVA